MSSIPYAHSLSVFANAYSHDPCGTTTAAELIDDVRSGRWAETVEHLRAALARGDDATYKRDKLSKLPAVTVSGLFSYAKDDDLTQHSGLLQLDVDHVDGHPVATLRDLIGADPHVLTAFISPSARGVKAFVRVDVDPQGDKHRPAVAAVDGHFRRHYGVKNDPAVKNPSRFCFVSHDPDATWNPDAVPLRAPVDGRPLTDIGNAERLADRYAGWLRHSPALGWVSWDGQRWVSDDGAAHRAMMATVRELYDEAAGQTDPDRRQALAKHAVKSESAARVRGALQLAQHMTPFSTAAESFDADRDILNTAGGIVDLNRAAERPHDQNALCRRIASVRVARFQVPVWSRFLRRVFADDQSLIDYIQLAVGYSLSGRTTEQCWFFGWGTGANGKSTFANVLLALAGEYGRRLPSESLMVRYQTGIPNDIAALAGARVVVASEVTDGARLNEGLIKDLTGQDSVSARFLNREWFDFRPQLTLWVMGNHKPIIRGTDHAIWRRVRLVPFTVTIPDDEQDPLLEQKLMAELDGIAGWAVDGARQWYQKTRLPDCAAITKATAGYRAESDVLGAFFEDCCVIGLNYSARSSALYAAYQSWCNGNGEHAMSGTRFGRALGDRGFQKHKSQHVSWSGIGLMAD